MSERIELPYELLAEPDRTKIYNFDKMGSELTGSGSKENNSEYNWTVDDIYHQKAFGKHQINATFHYMEWKKDSTR